MIAATKGLPPRKDNAAVARGEVGDSRKSETKFCRSNGDGVKPDLLAVHFCCCKPGVLCIFCIRWSRRIRAHEQRRAESLRHQALGQLARSGG